MYLPMFACWQLLQWQFAVPDPQHILPLVYPYVIHVIFDSVYQGQNYLAFVNRMMAVSKNISYFSHLNSSSLVSGIAHC